MKFNRLVSHAVVFSAATLIGMPQASPQQLERDVSVVSEEVAGQLEGFSYREGPESKLDFRGTAIALAASGRGEVEFQDGRARVAASALDVAGLAADRPIAGNETAEGRARNRRVEVLITGGPLSAARPALSSR